MENSSLVSIIIRTKNEERWISSCLDAVYSQNYKSFEVIVVDNESTDKTIEKVLQYPVKKNCNYCRLFAREITKSWDRII